MRWRRATAVLSLMAALALFDPAGPASAQAPNQQGWWTATNAGSPPVGIPVSPPSAPSDVPANGLLVEGGPHASSPTAYSALAYDLALGATAGTLTLAVAPHSATTPDTTLELCPLTGLALSPEQGGQMSDAPHYNCAKHVTAQSTDGKSFRFKVANLVSDGTLAVAILPTTPVDRVVFSQPAATSLEVSGGTLPSSTGSNSPAPTSSPASSQTPVATPATAVQPTSSGLGATTPAVTGGFSGSAGTPAAPPATAAASNRPNQVAAAPTPASSSGVPAVLSPGRPAAKPLAVALLALVALAGALVWSQAGRAAIRRAAGGNNSTSATEIEYRERTA